LAGRDPGLEPVESYSTALAILGQAGRPVRRRNPDGTRTCGPGERTRRWRSRSNDRLTSANTASVASDVPPPAVRTERTAPARSRMRRSAPSQGAESPSRMHPAGDAGRSPCRAMP
jgi:hypothetical protein